MITIIYHKADYDGLFSGIIAKKYYTGKGVKVDMYGWNYGDEIPEITEGSVILVDVSFPPTDMLKLQDTKRLTWIDHHQTAISDSETYGYSKVPGIRVIGTAACELTWRFFYPRKSEPEIVRLAGMYDVWNKDDTWETEVVPLQYGLKHEYGLGIKKLEQEWDDLCEDCDWLIDNGSLIYEWIKRSSEAWIKNNAFPVTVGGKYKGIAMVTPIGGSICFGSVLNDYDLYLVIQIRENGTKYQVSMYKENDRVPEFSCGEYMKQFGGGGHPGAAGSGPLSKEVFERLIYNHEF